MLTKENEYFDEDMIVEFSYDLTKKGHWRWIPLRVRYDKTNDLKNGGTNFGNAYHVANSNWHSIHNPITGDMISSGENVPDVILDEDVYYNESPSWKMLCISCFPFLSFLMDTRKSIVLNSGGFHLNDFSHVNFLTGPA